MGRRYRDWFVEVFSGDPIPMGEFFRVYCLTFLLGFAPWALWFWRPRWSDEPRKSVTDRMAWTIFGFGLSLMFNMVLLAVLSESDGDYRTWDTIELHRRWFLGFSMVPVAGPLIVFVTQKLSRFPSPKGNQKDLDDDRN
jgi:hypothetical protein